MSGYEVSDEAVEAARAVIFQGHRFQWGLARCACGEEGLTYRSHEDHLSRAALSAAAPHMLAKGGE